MDQNTAMQNEENCIKTSILLFPTFRANQFPIFIATDPKACKFSVPLLPLMHFMLHAEIDNSKRPQQKAFLRPRELKSERNLSFKKISNHQK